MKVAMKNNEIWEKPKRLSHIGGEALVEGVMMRGKRTIASTVRKSSGEMVTAVKTYIPAAKSNRIFSLPFIRGGVNMIESMIVGMGALMESAEQLDFEESESKLDKWIEKKFGGKSMTIIMYLSVILALVAGIAIFILLPNLLADFLPISKNTASGAFLANLVEGIIRIVIFLAYVWIISKNGDVRRVFQYHGAEHKTIFAYENMDELTVENVRKHARQHPRCGTTFTFVVVLISILIFALTGWHSKLVNVIIRLALLPVIAGVSYELFKLAARSESKVVKLISYPGILLQKITTQEPDDSMIEVAIASLKAVLEAEEGDSADDGLRAAQ